MFVDKLRDVQSKDGFRSFIFSSLPDEINQQDRAVIARDAFKFIESLTYTHRDELHFNKDILAQSYAGVRNLRKETILEVVDFLCLIKFIEQLNHEVIDGKLNSDIYNRVQAFLKD